MPLISADERARRERGGEAEPQRQAPVDDHEPITTEQKVIVVPTERSMPPVMITNVTPVARTPLTAVATRIEM